MPTKHPIETQATTLNELFERGEDELLYKKLLSTTKMIFFSRQGFVDEDFVAETAAYVFMNKDKFKGDSRFSTWVYRVISNKHLDWLKRQRVLRRREEVSLDEAVNLPSERAGPLRGELKDLLKRLEDKEIKMLLLLFLEDHTPQAICDLMNISRPTYFRKFNEALEALRELKDEDKQEETEDVRSE